MNYRGLPIDELDWTTLLAQVIAQKCTPFIGAGAAFGCLPLGRDLAEALIGHDERETGKKCPLQNRGDLQKASQYLAVVHREGDWPKRKIAELISPVDNPVFAAQDEPHNALANLRLPVYLTTNYDHFMHNALSRIPGVRPRIEFSRWTEDLMETQTSTFDHGYEPSQSDPVVFHLHGHAGCPESLVVSEDDYLDFIVRTSKEWTTSPTGVGQRSILPPRIRAAIRSSTLLFVGYSLEDVNFRLILRSLVGSVAPSSRRTSIAIQYSDDKPEELQNYLAQYFNWSLNLAVYFGSPFDFAAKLNKEWSAYYERRRTSAGPILR